MKDTTSTNLTFYSSWGILTTDKDGYVLNMEYDGDVENDSENYIKNIKRMDVFEMNQFFRLNRISYGSYDYDILEAGFWTGELWDYEKPDHVWRDSTFLKTLKKTA